MLTRTRPRIEAALEEIYAEPNFARHASHSHHLDSRNYRIPVQLFTARK